METIYIALICAFVILWIYYNGIPGFTQSEDFATLDEKARHLTTWIQMHPTGPYVEFIKANPDSNIVEYTKLRQLLATRQLTGIQRFTTAAKALRA